MTRRRWIADTWNGNSAALTGDQANHLVRVLRAKPGMEFDVVAGGHVHRAVIREVADDKVQLDLKEELDAASALPLTLLLAITKFDRFEWALEKATELGVAQIVPMIARRTERHLAQAALGVELAVPTLDGETVLKMPEGTQSGKVFRLKGKGIPVLNGHGKGDLLVRVMVQTPSKLTRSQRDLLKQLGDTLQVDNQPTSRSLLAKMKDLFN